MGDKVLELRSERLIRIGRLEGETHFAALITKRFSAGRIEDIKKECENVNIREQLYREFSLSQEEILIEMKSLSAVKVYATN